VLTATADLEDKIWRQDLIVDFKAFTKLTHLEIDAQILRTKKGSPSDIYPRHVPQSLTDTLPTSIQFLRINVRQGRLQHIHRMLRTLSQQRSILLDLRHIFIRFTVQPLQDPRPASRRQHPVGDARARCGRNGGAATNQFVSRGRQKEYELGVGSSIHVPLLKYQIRDWKNRFNHCSIWEWRRDLLLAISFLSTGFTVLRPRKFERNSGRKSGWKFRSEARA
jgi:hypothetical protein